MHFDREHIAAEHKQMRIDVGRIEHGLPIRSDRLQGRRVICDRSVRHIAAENFMPVEVNDSAVVAEQT